MQLDATVAFNLQVFVKCDAKGNTHVYTFNIRRIHMHYARELT